jgi:Abortive infection alpha
MNDLSETVNKAADLVHRLAGPVCDDIGAMISNSVKPYRAKNLVNTLRKTERILREAGLPANAVPTRLLFPIVEACSVEDNETLQDMWAGLLATASQETDSVSPSFAETLKQMTPDEARYIDKIYCDRTNPNNPHRMPIDTQLRFGHARSFTETFERLGIIRREYGMTEEHGKPEVGSLLRFTEYGNALLKACRGPRKTAE